MTSAIIPPASSAAPAKALIVEVEITTDHVDEDGTTIIIIIIIKLWRYTPLAKGDVIF